MFYQTSINGHTMDIDGKIRIVIPYKCSEVANWLDYKWVKNTAFKIIITLVLMITPALAVTEVTNYQSVSNDYPQQVFWGDTHMHTSLSADANIIGNRFLGPEDAYRFAKGQAITASNGMQARLKRPLDFLMISDHAEYLGLMPELRKGSDKIVAFADGRQLSMMIRKGGKLARKTEMDLLASLSLGTPMIENKAVIQSVWERSIAMADKANEPGRFTALIAFEWTSSPRGNNLHRVVVFRDNADKAGQIIPFSAFDSLNPEDLWGFMEDYQVKTGGKVLAIPHNSNLSNGLMFSETQSDGSPIDKNYSKRRSNWEPVMEITQIKGGSETHPLLSPNDEFANFGIWDKGNANPHNLPGDDGKKEPSGLKEPWMLKYEYARSALKLGLSLEERTGANPYQFGIIGSTDSHTSLTTADDDNFWGKGPPWEPGKPARAQGVFLGYGDNPENSIMNWEQLASGYAGVWAVENTREAVFDAIKRKEVYATTGPRITVRFFGGWDYTEDDLYRSDMARVGYEKGVPMGAELFTAKQDKVPIFMVAATKDPEGANLDRIQIIKGWLDKNGNSQEKVYNVAWSEKSRRGHSDKLESVGNTVDLDDATYLNNIGAVQLDRVWMDPDFDPAQRAFYYVRVLEIPTPRWVVYDKVRLGTKLPEDTQLIHQERAYTSPIWYKPIP